MEDLKQYSDKELSLRVMNTENLYVYVVDNDWAGLLVTVIGLFEFTATQMRHMMDTFIDEQEEN